MARPLAAALLAAALAGGFALDSTAAEGPPDAFGLTWEDPLSGCTGGLPAFGAAAVTVPGASSVIGPIALTWPWPWMFRTATEIWISPAGYVTFSDMGPPGAPQVLPDLALPNDLIAPFWFDASEADVTYEARPESFHVQWRQIVSPGIRTDVHLVLVPGGAWRMVWVDAAGVTTATVGHENADGTVGRTIYSSAASREAGFPDPGTGSRICVEPRPRLSCGPTIIACNGSRARSWAAGVHADWYSCTGENLAAGEWAFFVDVDVPAVVTVSSSDPRTRFLRIDGAIDCTEFDCTEIHGSVMSFIAVSPGRHWLVADAVSAPAGDPFTVTVQCVPMGDPILCGVPVTGDTNSGGFVLAERSCTLADMSARDLAYRLPVPVAGLLTLELENAPPGMWVQLHEASGFDANAGACVAAGEGSVTASVAAGDYVVVVDGPAGSEGAFTLHVDCGTSTLDCSSIPVLACGQIVSGTTMPRGSAAAYSCTTRALGGGESAWRFTNPVDQPVAFTLISGDPRQHVLVLRSCDPMDCFGGAVNPSLRSLPAGEYVVVVDGPMGSDGPYELRVDCGGIGAGSDVAVADITLLLGADSCGSLDVTGTARVDVVNASMAATVPLRLLAFEDEDGSGDWSAGDEVFGEMVVPPMSPATRVSLDVPIGGRLRFRDAPLMAWIDADEVLAEADEADNLRSSAQGCRVIREPGLFQPVLEWEWTGSSDLPDYASMAATPLVGDIDGDGIPEVIIATKPDNANAPTAVLRALSGRDGSEKWVASDPAARVAGWNQPALADLDGDGLPEIVTRSDVDLRRVIAIASDGTLAWTSDRVVTLQTQHGLGGAAIADLDGDGVPEIAWGAHVLRGDGTPYWTPEPGTVGSIVMTSDYSFPSIADITPDPGQELIAGPTVYASDGAGGGRIVWTRPDLGDGAVAIADLDQDGTPEIVLSSSRVVTCLEAATGATRWQILLPTGGPCGPDVGTPVAAPPAIADFDGDGMPEIALVARAYVVVLDADGRLAWQADVPSCNAFSVPSGFDFDADGAMEVLYLDHGTSGAARLRVLDGRTGAQIFELPTTRREAFASVVVADVDGDGEAEIVVPLVAPTPGVRVYGDATGSWVGARPIWSGQSHHGTNVRDDGTVPAIETPSWRASNTYRSQVGISEPGGVDLTIGFAQAEVRVLPNCSREIVVQARVGNAGTLASNRAVEATIHSGDPDAGGMLIASATIPSLAPGEWIDLPALLPLAGPGNVTLHARVDEAGSVRQCRVDNDACVAIVVNSPDGGDQRPADVGAALRLRDAGDPLLPDITAVLDWSLDEGAPRVDQHFHVERGTDPRFLLPLMAFEPLLGTSHVDSTPATPPANLPHVHYYNVRAADACEQLSHD